MFGALVGSGMARGMELLRHDGEIKSAVVKDGTVMVLGWMR